MESNSRGSDQEIATNDDDMKDDIIEECASEAEAASGSVSVAGGKFPGPAIPGT